MVKAISTDVLATESQPAPGCFRVCDDHLSLFALFSPRVKNETLAASGLNRGPCLLFILLEVESQPNLPEKLKA